MTMTHELICTWSDQKITKSLHPNKELAERKMQGLIRKPNLNRIKGETPTCVINELVVS